MSMSAAAPGARGCTLVEALGVPRGVRLGERVGVGKGSTVGVLLGVALGVWPAGASTTPCT